MWHFLLPVDGTDLVQCLDGGGQAAVHTEDLKDRERRALNPNWREVTQQETTSSLSSEFKEIQHNASHLAIDDSREGQVVEYLGAVSPHGDRAVLAEALVVEAVDLGDLPGLVVSPNQGYPVWITHLRRERDAERWTNMLLIFSLNTSTSEN